MKLFADFLYLLVFRMDGLSFLLKSMYLCDIQYSDVYLSTCRKHFPILSSFMTYHRVCNQIKTTSVTSGAGTSYLSGAPEFTPRFLVGFVLLDLQLYIYMFCRSLFVLLYFFAWPLFCLFFFDIRILITSLLSSNSSYHLFIEV